MTTLTDLADRIEKGMLKTEERRFVAAIIRELDPLIDAAWWNHKDEECDSHDGYSEGDCCICNTKRAVKRLDEIAGGKP